MTPREARWPSVGLVCKDLNCKNWVRPVEQKPTQSKKLENDPCEDLCFNLTIRMDGKNLLSRLPAARLLLLGFGPDCSKQYNHGAAAKGHRGYFMSVRHLEGLTSIAYTKSANLGFFVNVFSSSACFQWWISCLRMPFLFLEWHFISPCGLARNILSQKHKNKSKNVKNKNLKKGKMVSWYLGVQRWWKTLFTS